MCCAQLSKQYTILQLKRVLPNELIDSLLELEQLKANVELEDTKLEMVRKLKGEIDDCDLKETRIRQQKEEEEEARKYAQEESSGLDISTICRAFIVGFFEGLPF